MRRICYDNAEVNDVKLIMRRIINFIIVAAMLMAGMCFEHVEADSLFVHSAVKEIHTEVLTSAKDMPPLQTLCTNEMITSQRIECQEVQVRRSNPKSAVRTGINLSSMDVLPNVPLLNSTRMMEAIDHEPIGRRVIVAYIHHQDGEKRIL